MTKKSGLFEVDVDLNLLRLEKDPTVKHINTKSKLIEDAIKILR